MMDSLQKNEKLLWWIGIFFLLLGSLAIRMIDLDSDPPADADKDMSLTIDGSWYAGASIDWATDRSSEIGSSYDPPVFGAVARSVFYLLGPSRWSANFIGVIFGLVAVLFTVLAAKKLYGNATGLIAGAILSLSYPYFVYSRSPGIYVPLSAFTAMLLYLSALRENNQSKRQIIFDVGCWGVVLIGIVGVKPIFLLNGIALVLTRGIPSCLKRRDSTHTTRIIALGVGIVTAGLFIFLALNNNWFYAQYHKIMEYLQVGGGLSTIPGRWLIFEHRSGIFSLAPVIILLAAGGVLYLPTCRDERLAIWTLVVYTILLATLGYSPVRYFLPVFPALALLAARSLYWLLDHQLPNSNWFIQMTTKLIRPPNKKFKLVRGFRLLLVSYLSLQIILGIMISTDDLTVLASVILAIAVGIILEMVLGSAEAPWKLKARNIFAFLILVLLIGGNFMRGGKAFATTNHSIPAAGDEVEIILHPAAHLTGPFAHVLTYETPNKRTYLPVFEFGDGKLRDELYNCGFTHFAVDVSNDNKTMLRAFQQDGVPLQLIHEFFIREQKVHLYRFPWADEIAPRTDFELGIQALQDGDLKQAREYLQKVHDDYPESTSVASVLAAVLLESGEMPKALPLLEYALECNPQEVSAMRTLIQIHLQRKDLFRARLLLEELIRLDPEDRDAARVLREIKRK